MAQTEASWPVLGLVLHGVGEEVRELLQQVRVRLEERCDLVEHVPGAVVFIARNFSR